MVSGLSSPVTSLVKRGESGKFSSYSMEEGVYGLLMIVMVDIDSME